MHWCGSDINDEEAGPSYVKIFGIYIIIILAYLV